MGLTRKVREVAIFLGIIEDDRLEAAIPSMRQQQLIHKHQLFCLKSGSAGMGVTLTTISSMICPAFLFGTAYNLRQYIVARMEKKKLKKEMTSTGHVHGSVCFAGARATVKALTFTTLLSDAVVGNIENYATTHPPHQLLEYLSHDNAVATHEFEGVVHEAFVLPHSVSQNEFVKEELQKLADAPKDEMLKMLDEEKALAWGQIGSDSVLGHQLAVGLAMEANAPALLVDKVVEIAVEEWNDSRHRVSRA